MRRRAAAVAVLGAVLASPAAAEKLELHHYRVDLHPEDEEVTEIGKLAFRGGLDIYSDDPRFGGLSALEIGADGETLIAVSDRGYWVTARLRYDRKGFLKSIGSGRIGPLRDFSGRPVATKARGDAEALARIDGERVVAFERRHRLWLYPADGDPLGAVPGRAMVPDDSERLPRNGGIEALTGIGNGRLLAIAEGREAAVDVAPAWIVDRGRWRRLAYARTGRFRPTGAATLPGGDVLVLERRFTWAGGMGSRIVRIAGADIRPGARLSGREVAALELPLTVENFEGIAVRTRGDGTVLVYLVSDDNFHALQRTLLLMFALDE